MTKMTYVTAIDFAINAITDNDEVVEKLKALKSQIEKKNSADRKPTKTQQENEVLKDEIVGFLTERRTATEVADRFGVSVNKATAMLTLLKQAGRVTREVEKRKAYYIAVNAE